MTDTEKSQLSLMNLTYEEQRLENIRKNEELLRSLGLETPSEAKSLATPSSLKTAGKQRRYDDGLAGESNTARNRPGFPRKQRTNDVEDLTLVPHSAVKRRRSVRLGGREKPNYTKELVTFNGDRDTPNTPSRYIKSTHSHPDSEEGDIRQGKISKLGVRLHNPKTFGHIPGVEVGKWWATRMEASADAVHAPTVAGISGNANDGAWSVALSGGYPDDIDLGYAFTYTGCGGRDLKGTKQNPKNLRTAPQTSHQSFDNPLNAALKRSAETRNPVRVIRGFKLQSKYAPPTGYRYDGLYVVEKAWMAKGLTNGLMVCRYAFKRMDDQEPLPERDLDHDDDNDKARPSE
ncbi:conserved hypothetical protein [Cryptococcus deneoformans JEC21]|uniref:YDG domain-containing protein n=1 Tax=Cryptococcus deneoformans (strain JEC21 / ATCC MYA-565) TaxID=214684 RepID=Q5KNG7_CRYD1|nr:conserved hypothetical protein [Cryptococcus neoformans var. neoformans JEC21]AAW41176.2 conserved hypothetical protein [Cryptococcus neoformans var. neoformans JEC21]